MKYFNSRIAISISLMLMISACSESPQEKAARTCEDGILSYMYAKDFVKTRLKSPSTAEFPSFGKVSYEYQGNCTHMIIGTVDAQNLFGAMTRNYFDVTVRYDHSEETYYLENIVVE